eukprot:4878103-Pleurochrysis_carterae.AAC.1
MDYLAFMTKYLACTVELYPIIPVRLACLPESRVSRFRTHLFIRLGFRIRVRRRSDARVRLLLRAIMSREGLREPLPLPARPAA